MAQDAVVDGVQVAHIEALEYMRVAPVREERFAAIVVVALVVALVAAIVFFFILAIVLGFTI